MNIDCYFARGKTHLVCQDYALAMKVPVPGASEPVPEVPFVVLSDGCSSSPHTDLGARLLCLNALRFLEYGWTGEWEQEEVIDRTMWASVVNAVPVHRVKGPPLDSPSCLDATLLMAAPHEYSIRVVVAGDGVVCARRRDSQVIDTYRISFNGNAPGYPSYQLSTTRFQTYLAGHGLRTVEHFVGRELAEALEEQMECNGYEAFETIWTHDFPQEEYDLVVLFSDGVESFQREEIPGRFVPVDMFDVLDHLLALKNFKGQFAVRRMRRFLSKFCQKNKWHHNDDLAMAAIYLGES